MGSEQNKRNGLDRRSDGATGHATQYTIVDLDIGAADLAKRYVGTKRAEWVGEVIRGCVQRQRTAHPPSDAFIAGLARARKVDAIMIVDLGRDGTKDGWEEDPATGKKRKAGANHCVVVDGRQRTMSFRAIDAASENPPRLLAAEYFVPSAKTPYEDVVNLRVGSAIRVPRSVLSRAEDAFDMREMYSLADIAPKVEAMDAAEVSLLIALHGCDDCVKDAVASGKIGLAKVAALATLDPIEQVRRVARMLGGTRKEKDAAAAPRPKARPAKLSAGLVREFDALGINGETRALAAWFAGDDGALAEHPRLARALDSAREQA